MMPISSEDIKNLNTSWPLPKNKKPIILIGAGGIVNDAHLPAYKKSGFEAQGIYDPIKEKAEKLAEEYKIKQVFSNINDAILDNNVVYDIAVPPSELLSVVKKLPNNSVALLQKPMGNSLEEAKEIKNIVKEKSITAAVNLQLKFSPMMLVVRDAIDKKFIGEITELEICLSVGTPWHLWPFLKDLNNVEVPLHSIHYIDWIRSVLGEPKSVYCKSVKHPNHLSLSDCRSSIILDYGEKIRCCLSLNHTHNTEFHGLKHSHAYARLEGQNGAAYIKFGLLLNYPKGEPEEVEISSRGVEWTKVNNVGSWFPDAFIGTMSNLQRFAVGEDEKLLHSIDDSYNTMTVVYACLKSNSEPGTPIPS